MTRIRTTLALASISVAVLAVAGCGSDTAAPPAAATATAVIGTLPVEQSITAAPPATTVATAAPAPIVTSAIAAAPTAAVAVDPAAFDNGSGVVGWVSPSGNIYCKLSGLDLESGCQSGDAPVPDGANCASPTFTVDQLSKGFILRPDSVIPECFNQGIFGVENAKTLPYDKSISYQGFTCTSRTTGMSCVNGTGHGFVLSLQEARAF